jgi:hypothetical protein
MALMFASRLAGGGIFEPSEAEMAFHPWWTAIERYATFSIIIVGKKLIKTHIKTMVSIILNLYSA